MAKAKKEVNTEMVVRAESAISIAKEIQDITTKLIEAGGECDDATLAELNWWQVDFQVKAQNIAYVQDRLDYDIEYFKAIEAAAKAKRTAAEMAQKRLKKYLFDCMVISNERKISGDLHTISRQDGKISLVIDNENLIPYHLADVVELIKPKTAEIKEILVAALEAETAAAAAEGRDIDDNKINIVPGAHLERGEGFISIRKAGKKDNSNE